MKGYELTTVQFHLVQEATATRVAQWSILTSFKLMMVMTMIDKIRTFPIWLILHEKNQHQSFLHLDSKTKIKTLAVRNIQPLSSLAFSLLIDSHFDSGSEDAIVMQVPFGQTEPKLVNSW